MSQVVKVPVWLDCDPGRFRNPPLRPPPPPPPPPAKQPTPATHPPPPPPIPHTTHNALSILTAIGRPSIPVYPGSSTGLVRPAVHAPAIHGTSGLDGTDLLPVPKCAARTEPWLEAMADALLGTEKGTSWIVATGALTNIALLFQQYPELAGHVKGLSLMGGAVGNGFTNAPMGKVDDRLRIGNWSAWAEFNILLDPEAAASLFSNPVLNKKMVMIPLDVTHQVLATEDVQAMLLHGKGVEAKKGVVDAEGKVGEGKSVLKKMLVELLLFFAKTYRDVFGIGEGPPLHDPLAVAVVLNGIVGAEIPFYDFVEASRSESTQGERKEERSMGERYHVDVITEGSHDDALSGAQTGRTVVRLLGEGEEGVKIPRGLDVERFWDVVEECLARADAVNETGGVA